MDKLVQIRQLPNGRWRVYSRSGKNLGTFSSKKLAQKRASQFFRFVTFNNFRKKQAQVTTSNSDTLITAITYSSILRKLRQEKPELVIRFLTIFKQAFDAAVEKGLEDLEQVALLETAHKLQENHDS